MSDICWQKSSFSEQSPEASCVELARPGGAALLLRESDDPGVIATASPARVRSLLHATKRGAFDKIG
jgi:hypothetical protein